MSATLTAGLFRLSRFDMDFAARPLVFRFERLGDWPLEVEEAVVSRVRSGPSAVATSSLTLYRAPMTRRASASGSVESIVTFNVSPLEH